MRNFVICIIALVVCITAMVSTAIPVSAASGDEIRAPKKIISIVYDDSGSMVGDRWVYTSYAMQGLIALLNEEDELYITFMSSPSTAQQFPLDDIGQAVGRIHAWTDNKYGALIEKGSHYTPYTSMQSLCENITSISKEGI